MAFAGGRGEFIFALTLTGGIAHGKKSRAAMMDLMGQHGRVWAWLMAAATSATISAALLSLAAQHFSARGLTAVEA